MMDDMDVTMKVFHFVFKITDKTPCSCNSYPEIILGVIVSETDIELFSIR